MKDIKMRRFAFEMERIAIQHRLSNMEIEFRPDDHRGELIIELTRRLAVRREMFESDQPPQVTKKHETVRLYAAVPLTWWDHAKMEVGFLRWLAEKGMLGDIHMSIIEKSKRIETVRTEKHYVQAVTILDDQREIPAHQRNLEIGIWDQPEGGPDYRAHPDGPFGERF
tara:strand:- start:150 stop:653 length:504 start_codon:yes stop_codon:yes gene_type:complete